MRAINILNEIITNLSPDNFIRFFREKNRSFRPLDEELPQYDDENFSSALMLGEIPFDQGEKLLIFTLQSNKPLSERSSKKAQYEKGKKILRDTYADAGIFIFYDQKGSFRFSLIYPEYTGTRRQWSYYKRFTYFVSPEFTNKTFLQQIGEGDFSSLQKIKEAFSVEPVTKQFYNELQSWYFMAMDKVKFPDDYKYSIDPKKDKEIRNATNLIRLITRIIFIRFLMEKGLVPTELFSREKLKHVVKDFMKNKNSSNFYNAILQNLFFATLNQKMTERKFALDSGFQANRNEYGVKTLYRYANMFLISEDEVLNLFREIPFLNGGLFDCLDKEDETGKVIYIDGFSRNPKKQAIIPDYLFFMQEEERVDLSQYGLGSNKPVRGLIEILNSYNFTIDENTPVDQEIALDPELLGKVFENLLASYNPETATTARKATGSYYTPREIVDYMVDESLIAYLSQKLDNLESVDKDTRLRHLLSYTDEPHLFNPDEVKVLINAIDNIKILDPACGSGAFPMGILHKLVHILQKLDPDNEYWHELQYQKALKESEEVFKHTDKHEREERLKEINDAFDESINYPDYARKLYLIENCIYGVDIQPIAIQISKLRFFISLVLDQKVDRSKENLGIRALPNLETKFVAANTLIGLDKPKQMKLIDIRLTEKEEELKRLRHRYFEAKTRKEKLEYQRKDKKIRQEIAEILKNGGWSSDVVGKIAFFDLYDQNASANWFDPEWMFGLVPEDGNTGVFDIVIGNPPYGARIDNIEILSKKYKHYDRQKNSASFFIEIGINSTNSKGVIAYIVPKSLSFSEGWKKTRELVTHKNKLLTLIDVSKAFEAVLLEQIIICYSKETNVGNYRFFVGDSWTGEIKIRGQSDNKLIDQLDILPVYVDNKKQSILNKLQKNSVLLSEISKTFRGLPFQSKVSKSGQPILRGKNIGKYIIYGNIDNITLPKEILANTKVRELLKPKIISQRIVAHVMNPYDRIIIMATIDKQGVLTLDTVMNTFLTTDKFTLQYVLAILNSQLASWFYYWFVYNRAIRTMDFDKYYIGKLPIKDIDLQAQQPFITLVDQILEAKQQPPSSPFSKGELHTPQSPLNRGENLGMSLLERKQVVCADTSALEQEIDKLVYKLYDLTEEEIAIIEEGKNELSK